MTAAWTKKAGKNPAGGLNEAGRKSYERENPGSDLKAVRKRNQSGPLARRAGVKGHAGHGTVEVNSLYCDSQTISTKIVHKLFV